MQPPRCYRRPLLAGTKRELNSLQVTRCHCSAKKLSAFHQPPGTWGPCMRIFAIFDELRSSPRNAERALFLRSGTAEVRNLRLSYNSWPVAPKPRPPSPARCARIPATESKPLPRSDSSPKHIFCGSVPWKQCNVSLLHTVIIQEPPHIGGSNQITRLGSPLTVVSSGTDQIDLLGWIIFFLRNLRNYVELNGRICSHNNSRRLNASKFCRCSAQC